VKVEDSAPIEVVAGSRVRLALFASALLCSLTVARLPWSASMFRVQDTPFDRGKARFMAPGYALLSEAALMIPPGSSVIVQCEPANPMLETFFWRFAVALLPHRRILPLRHWESEESAQMRQATDYLVLWGPPPAVSPGDLLLKKPFGSIWRIAAAP
jgi:hypothetical protein